MARLRNYFIGNQEKEHTCLRNKANEILFFYDFFRSCTVMRQFLAQ